jgi:YrbI family 3-deoxy-D-manno-octulosonate 8-phosphate phosphatase
MPTRRPSLTATLRALRGIAFDFDGVMTDNRVWVSEDGREMVACNRSDGLGLDRLRALGLKLIVLSKERNPVCQRRAEKLKLECENGLDDKVPRLRAFAERHGLTLDQIAYVGNDINDIPCLKVVGLPVVVADAWPEVRRQARLRLTRPGGHGAVREFSDRVWRARGGRPVAE